VLYVLFISFTDLLTYLLTPCSRVLLEKPTGSQLVKKFPSFYGTPKFILLYLVMLFDEKYKLLAFQSTVSPASSHFVHISTHIPLSSVFSDTLS
jgi:hypothetical protein